LNASRAGVGFAIATRYLRFEIRNAYTGGSERHVARFESPTSRARRPPSVRASARPSVVARARDGANDARATVRAQRDATRARTATARKTRTRTLETPRARGGEATARKTRTRRERDGDDGDGRRRAMGNWREL
jgi:hypothetical protein